VVIDLLGDPVNGIFLVVDGDVVFANDSAESLDLVIHLLLVDSETIDLETRLSINCVEDSKTVVKLASFEVKELDLLLFWLNSSVQILDFEIKHKLELFKFLGLFLELVNLLFSNTDITILFGDLFFKSRCFLAEFLVLDILFADKELLIVN
jgi:hypothetical protein